MSLRKEVRDSLRIWWKDFQDFRRKKSLPPVVWVQRWNGSKYFLSEETCSQEIDRLLVYLKIADSRSEAQRLIKSGSIEIRDFACDTFWKIVQQKDSLKSGWPYLIRKGKKVFGVETVMVPNNNQTLWVWEELICGLS